MSVAGEALSVNQLATTLMSLTGTQVGVAYLPARRGDIRSSIGSPAQAARELGIVAKTSVTQGLRELVHYVVKTGESRSAG